MAKREGETDDRRVTFPIEALREKPEEIAKQALTKEVELVVDESTRIYLARKLPPLDR